MKVLTGDMFPQTIMLKMFVLFEKTELNNPTLSIEEGLVFQLTFHKLRLSGYGSCEKDLISVWTGDNPFNGD